jgi:hypothetical protein
MTEPDCRTCVRHVPRESLYLCLLVLPPVSRRCRFSMLYDAMLSDVQLLGFSFALLTTIAMLVKHERRLKRWLLKGSKRKKKAAIRPALW